MRVLGIGARYGVCPTANRALRGGRRHVSRLRFDSVECKTGNCSRSVRLNITGSHVSLWKNFVPEPNTNQISEALQFSRFRFKLIQFLRLPFNIREPALREVLERTCGGVYGIYLVRAERVAEILKSEDALEMNLRVPVTPLDRQRPLYSLQNN
jgi:hypothetical protein